MKPVLTILLSLATSLTLSTSGLAQDSGIPGPSFDDLVNLNNAGSPRISPDGRSVVYTVRTTDWEHNRYDTEIWLAWDGAEPLKLTHTDGGNSTSPRWSPDGEWIGFLAKRGEKQQIHLIRARGGEAWTLTDAEEDIGGLAWAPDGGRIAFIMTEPAGEEDEKRKEKYGEFAVEDAEYRQSHLWLIEIPETARTAEATRLTEGAEFTVRNFEWSPDGSRIAFAHQPDPSISSFMRSDISLLEVETQTITALVDDPGSDGTPLPSRL